MVGMMNGEWWMVKNYSLSKYGLIIDKLMVRNYGFIDGMVSNYG